MLSTTDLCQVSGLALVFCLAIVLANLSLRFIPVSFNQACHLACPPPAESQSAVCRAPSVALGSCLIMALTPVLTLVLGPGPVSNTG